jgi:hypothetical protein
MRISWRIVWWALCICALGHVAGCVQRERWQAIVYHDGGARWTTVTVLCASPQEKNREFEVTWDGQTIFHGPLPTNPEIVAGGGVPWDPEVRIMPVPLVLAVIYTRPGKHRLEIGCNDERHWKEVDLAKEGEEHYYRLRTEAGGAVEIEDCGEDVMLIS